MPFAAVNGIELYYEIVGSGPPLVFVHGGFGGLGTGVSEAPAWRDRFADRLRVITFDRRSSGRSSFPDSRHSLEGFAADIGALLGQLGIQRTAVWGSSAGGPIALTYALEYPELVSALVVSDSAPRFFGEDETARRLRERIAILETEGPEAAYRARQTGGTVGLELFAADRPAAGEEERLQRERSRAQIRQLLAATPAPERIARYAGELRTYRAYLDYDARGRLRELLMPVLFIHATGDTLFPNPGWVELTAGMPNVTHLSLEGAEHGAGATDAAALDAILRFLSTTSAR